MKEHSEWIRVTPEVMSPKERAEVLHTEISLRYATVRRSSLVHLSAFASIPIAFMAWWPHLFRPMWRNYWSATWILLSLMAAYSMVIEERTRQRLNRLLAAARAPKYREDLS